MTFQELESKFTQRAHSGLNIITWKTRAVNKVTKLAQN